MQHGTNTDCDDRKYKGITKIYTTLLYCNYNLRGRKTPKFKSSQNENFFYFGKFDGIFTNIHVFSTAECADGQQQLHVSVVAVPPQNLFPSCSCNHGIDEELQMKTLELEIQT